MTVGGVLGGPLEGTEGTALVAAGEGGALEDVWGVLMGPGDPLGLFDDSMVAALPPAGRAPRVAGQRKRERTTEEIFCCERCGSMLKSCHGCQRHGWAVAVGMAVLGL